MSGIWKLAVLVVVLVVVLLLAVACTAQAQVPTLAPEGSPERIFQEAVATSEPINMTDQIEALVDAILVLRERIVEIEARLSSPRYGSIEAQVGDLTVRINDLERLIDCLRYSTGC